MAVSRGSAGALGVLRDILGQQTQVREADKQRGMQIMQMKVASDEADLERMHRRNERVEQELLDLNREFAKVTGVQRSIERLQKESNIRSDAAGIVSQYGTKLAGDRAFLQQERESMQNQIAQRQGEMSEYMYTLKSEAPAMYRQLVKESKQKKITDKYTIDYDEMTAQLEKLEKEGDLSDVRRAALQAGIAQRSELGVSQALAERGLDIRAAQLRGAGGAGSMVNKFMDSKIKEFNSKVGNMANTVAAKGDKLKGQFKIANLYSGQRHFGAPVESIAKNFADLIVEYTTTASREDPDIDKLASEYEKAKDENPAEAKKMAVQLMNKFRSRRAQLGKLDFYDGIINIFRDKDPEVASYMSDMLDAVDIVDQIEGTLFNMGMIDPENMSFLRYSADMAGGGEAGVGPGGAPPAEEPGVIRYFYDLLDKNLKMELSPWEQKAVEAVKGSVSRGLSDFWNKTLRGKTTQGASGEF